MRHSRLYINSPGHCNYFETVSLSCEWTQHSSYVTDMLQNHAHSIIICSTRYPLLLGCQRQCGFKIFAQGFNTRPGFGIELQTSDLGFDALICSILLQKTPYPGYITDESIVLSVYSILPSTDLNLCSMFGIVLQSLVFRGSSTIRFQQVGEFFVMLRQLEREK